MNFLKVTDVTTHLSPDLDACLATYILIRHLCRKELQQVNLHFVPAGSTGDGINVDTGLGEFDHHQEGVDCCAASLVWQRLKDGPTKEGLTDLILMVSRQDLNGGIFPKGICVSDDKGELHDIPQDLRTTSLQAVLSGMKERGIPDHLIMFMLFEMFESILTLCLKRLKAQKNYSSKATLISKHVVFIEDCTPQLMGIAFRSGALAIIYRETLADGKHAFGIKRQNDLTVDLNGLKGWDGFGDEEWFFHSAGFLACLGDRKNPNGIKSNVDPEALASQFETMLESADKS